MLTKSRGIGALEHWMSARVSHDFTADAGAYHLLVVAWQANVSYIHFDRITGAFQM